MSHIFYIWLCLVGFNRASEAGIGQREAEAEQQGGTRMAMRDKLIDFHPRTRIRSKTYCREQLWR